MESPAIIEAVERTSKKGIIKYKLSSLLMMKFIDWENLF